MPVHFPHLYLFWALLGHIPAMPSHFIPWASSAHFIPQASSIHFLLLYLFYSHGIFLNHLSFHGPITTSLHHITFRAYWPLCQPHEFTNSFLRLSRPIYFFFISYYSHELITSFLGLPWPICFFFSTNYFCEPADHYSCHSDLLVFALIFSLPIFFILLGFIYHWPLYKNWAQTFS